MVKSEFEIDPVASVAQMHIKPPLERVSKIYLDVWKMMKDGFVS